VSFACATAATTSGAATAIDALGDVIRAGSVAPELLTAPERVVPLRPARR
jgi:hypothetical protein